MKTWVKWTLTPFALFGLFHVLTLFDFNWDQDRCSFGPVTNAKYRELLSKAKARQANDWPPLVHDYSKASLMLDNRFYDLTVGSPSVYERIAAMHAVMRAMGAVYSNWSYYGGDRFQKAAQSGKGSVSFEYNVDINRLGFFAPFLRRAWLPISLSAGSSNHPSYPLPSRDQRGGFAFHMHFQNLLDPLPNRGAGDGGACPPVPAAEFASAFEPATIAPRKRD